MKYGEYFYSDECPSIRWKYKDIILNNEKKVDNPLKNGSTTSSIGEILNKIKDMPEQKFIIPGVIEHSFGFVFGPPKSGKTVYTETLLLNYAANRKSFLDYPLPDGNRICLFISLEEGGKLERYKRNETQIASFSDEEQNYILKNYFVSTPEMPTHILSESHWDEIEKAIEKNTPSVVVIDSLNRLTIDSIAEEESAKTITKRLIDIVKKHKVALFVINHTTKISNESIQTFASMSGSRIYGSEADFMIAVNRLSTNARYAKLVLSRHDRDDLETVDKFEITDDRTVELVEKVPEYSLFLEGDGRIDDSNSDLVWDEIQGIIVKKESNKFQSSDLKFLHEDKPPKMSKPTFHSAINKLCAKGKLCRIDRNKGIYEVII